MMSVRSVSSYPQDSTPWTWTTSASTSLQPPASSSTTSPSPPTHCEVPRDCWPGMEEGLSTQVVVSQQSEWHTLHSLPASHTLRELTQGPPEALLPSSLTSGHIQQPTSTQRGVEKSSVQEPGLQQPGPQQPGLQQPVLQQPGLQRPGLQQIGPQLSGVCQPDVQQPDHKTSSYFYNINATSTDCGGFKKVIGHHEHDPDRGWVSRRAEAHPVLTVSISVSTEAYSSLRLPPPRILHRHTSTPALMDTGAQLTVAGLPLIHALGVSEEELHPLSNSVRAANSQAMELIGGLFITVSGRDGAGNTRVSQQLCYITRNTTTLFISKSGCRDLGVVDKDFPSIGLNQSVSMASLEEQEIKTTESKLSGYGSNTKLSHQAVKPPIKCEHDEENNCVCPRRVLAPDAPTSLPFPATEQNRGKLQKWIIDHYGSSAFNQCECQPLPLMTGAPPLKLFIDPDAKPVAIHKPRPVPIHFQSKVKAGLDRDVALGVLEKIPVGVPTLWCSPMVVTPKKNGEPRRVVDLQALNRVALRQTHATESPYHQAVGIPRNTYKSILDAFEGYHSVPLEPSETHYTEFLSPWGRYKYLTSPQGFLAAGDGYTHRYDKIVKDVKDFKKCVDDTCL